MQHYFVYIVRGSGTKQPHLEDLQRGRQPYPVIPSENVTVRCEGPSCTALHLICCAPRTDFATWRINKSSFWNESPKSMPKLEPNLSVQVRNKNHPSDRTSSSIPIRSIKRREKRKPGRVLLPGCVQSDMISDQGPVFPGCRFTPLVGDPFCNRHSSNSPGLGAHHAAGAASAGLDLRIQDELRDLKVG